MGENLTDEQVTQFNDSMHSALDDFFHNIMTMNNECGSIKEIVKSNDDSLSSKWANLQETIALSMNTFSENNKVLKDTLDTFELNVKSLHDEGLDTANLANNVFKDFIERINAL